MLDLNLFDSMRIRLASPETIRSWSHGEVKKPETINYRTLKPERDGLFCERIFGPTRDWECHCGKYKRVRYKGTICDRCGVEVTRSKVRRERMGHIELAAPVSHIWYFKGIPSRMGLLLDMSPRSLERVLYFASYVVLQPAGDLKLKDLLTEGQYRQVSHLPDLRVGMGAEAIYELLANLDLEQMSRDLRAELKSSNGQKRIRAIRRLEVVEAFRKSGNRPEWMILSVIPVIPPELRPMVQLDGGRFATSDLNDLYRRVINRNNRLNRLLKLRAPEIIVRNEKRMLQEAVDALIDNGRRGRPVTGPGNRPLKSLSDMLKGKQGRFRQNLLGKRVDYSGRSVIVVGPELKLHQCGLPKEMALELFKPFVMRKLSADFNMTIKAAKKKVDRATPDVWAVLEDVIKEHPVLLNRAPTLHRLGIQAFEPVLTEGRAIKLHPLACTAYNADFDGDQMAIHLPLSAEAQAEARVLMLAANHILAPKDGKPIIVPTQDMVLGIYYLTILRPGAKGEGKIFSSPIEARLAFENGVVDLQAKIKVRDVGTLVSTSVGRLIFAEILPPELKYFSENVMDKKQLSILVAKAFEVLGGSKTAQLIDNVKTLGYKSAAAAGLTVAGEDVITPPAKAELLKLAQAQVKKVENFFARGLLCESERYAKVCQIWSDTTEAVGRAMLENMDRFNPVYMMADSGARGNRQQLRQLAGMRGLMADPSGKIIDIPITANFREGLSVSDYFISSHGARKGLADTALRTADSGYLTRRLVDVAQDIIIRQKDCARVSINLKIVRAAAARDPFDALEIIAEDLCGKALDFTVLDIPAGTILSEDLLLKIASGGATEISVDGRRVFLGNGDNLVAKFLDKFAGCRLDGKILTRDDLKALLAGDLPTVSVQVPSLSFIEVEAIQSGGAIIETLAERIVGRTLAEDVYDDNAECAMRNSQLNSEVDDSQDITHYALRTTHYSRNSQLNSECDTNQDITHYALRITHYPRLIARANETITAALAEKIAAVRTKVKIRSVLTCKAPSGVCQKCYGHDLSTLSDVDLGEAVGIIAAQSIGEPGTQLTMRTFHTGGVAGGDITQGLPRVEELFEARKPKLCAILADVSGVVTFGEPDKNNLRTVIINAGENGENTREYSIPYGISLTVKEGDYITAGDRLTPGPKNPHDILRICGLKETYKYLVKEVQKVYKSQGVEINDKHIEVMVRQMLHKVKIEDSGSTEFLPGEFVDINVFESENTKAIEEDRLPAVATPILLGITKASLATDSFLSAASFQETTRVLTDAAIKGKIDPLIGLKENVIIGKLIPAGTGMAHYRTLEVIDKENQETTDQLTND